MGIYDREYYRGETHGSGWLSGVAPACKAIIVINIVAFFAKGFFAPDRSTGAEFVQLWFEASDAGIFGHGRVWQLLTATFLHDGTVPPPLEHAVPLGGRARDGVDVRDARLRRDVPERGGHQHAGLGGDGPRDAGPVAHGGGFRGRSGPWSYSTPSITRIARCWSSSSSPWRCGCSCCIFLGIDAWELFQGTAGRTAVASHLTGAAYGFLFKQFDLRWSRLRLGRMRRPEAAVDRARAP